jgi:hypothetical protein
MMRKRLCNFIKYNWISIGLGLLILLLLSGGSFAAYTSMSSVKRVISTGNASELLFSSNYMTAYDLNNTDWSTKVIVFNNSENPTISVSVCNYEQGNTTKVNDSDIQYQFIATLLTAAGETLQSNTKLTITDESGNVTGTVTGEKILSDYSVITNGKESKFSEKGVCQLTQQSLTGGTTSRNVYKIKLAGEYLDYVNVQVQAIPVDANGNTVTAYTPTNSKQLARILSSSVYTTQQNIAWSGSFTDSNDIDAQKYDGLNYELSGYGEGTVSLIWDTDKIEISPWFLEDIGVGKKDIVVDKENHTKTIQFKVGSDITVRSYRIQFYRVEAVTSQENWTDVKSYITCSFEASEAEDEEENEGENGGE